MDFHFNLALAEKYRSNSQKSRELTEDWVSRNLYCPVCGAASVGRYENNHPVGDFFCDKCESDFELKSKRSATGKLSNIISDGEYSTMISRITSFRNPNFFFMTHKDWTVQNLILIPNHFFTPSIIKKRSPLGPNARRAGWTGCGIDISGIPASGKIFIIKDRVEVDPKLVIDGYAKTKALRTADIKSRGWLLDILLCAERIPGSEFTLEQMYGFEGILKQKHPENNFVKDKIRQQLQFLRDKGFIEFLGNGNYRKISGGRGRA